jgi:hypothetical protein
VIIDYKFVKAWSVMQALARNKDDWDIQLNIYKWLVETVKRVPVKGLQICAIIKDYSPHAAQDNYPEAEAVMIDVPMWDSVTAEAFVRKRLEMHRNAKVNHEFGEELQACTDEERWMSEAVFAVKREGRKSAIRLFKTLEEATELAERKKAMSKPERANPSDAQETSVVSASGVNSTKERSMSPHDLMKINVNEHTEKKNGLTYLSWAWAWQEALKADPTASFEVKTFMRDQYTELPYMDVNGTGMVWVTVTMFKQPRTCMLPVMDHRNKPIMNPDAFQVNTAIMRCMTKALALHGLGSYIYAGDDLPASDEKEAPTTMGELTKKEDGPKYENILAKTAWDNSDESRKLFADGMIEYTSHCTTVAGLNSYWKSNDPQLDSLKVTHPSLYEKVLSHFKALKIQLSKETT